MEQTTYSIGNINKPDGFRFEKLEGAAKKAEDIRNARLEEQSRPLVMTDEYRKLFKQIKDSGWVYALNDRELTLLSEYFFTEAPAKERETLIDVLCEAKSGELIKKIYDLCQENFDKNEYFPMFGNLSKNRKFSPLFEKLFGISAESIFSEFAKGNAVSFINSEAGHGGNGRFESYAQALEALGINKEKRLYNECLRLYIIVCDAGEYRRIGAEKLTEIYDGFGNEYRLRLLRNMLNVLDSYQLRSFLSMCGRFEELTGKAGTEEYKNALTGVSEKGKTNYGRMLAQYTIYRVLPDRERSDFWIGFIDECKVDVYREDTLFLRFRNFTVIEFKDECPAYFYDNEYIKKVVSEGLLATDSQETLKEWLYSKTEWGSQGENLQHWRKAHKDKWQFDVKNYISYWRRTI